MIHTASASKVKVLTIVVALQLASCVASTQSAPAEQGVAIGSGNGAIVGEAEADGSVSPQLGATIGALGGVVVGREEDSEKKRK